MKYGFVFSALMISFVAGAQVLPSADRQLSVAEKTALEENPCIEGSIGRVRIETGHVNREFKRGSEHIGVTSFGDVAVLKNNNVMVIHACVRGFGIVIGGGSSSLLLEDSGVNCSTGEILSYTIQGFDGRPFFFRSPRFSMNDSLCFNTKPRVDDSSRSEIKEVESSSSESSSSSSVFGI